MRIKSQNHQKNAEKKEKKKIWVMGIRPYSIVIGYVRDNIERIRSKGRQN